MTDGSWGSMKPAAAVQATDTEIAEELPIPELRRALDDLFVPNPGKYWADFLASAACFYFSFAGLVFLPLDNPVKYAAGVVAVLALYRSVVFIHELMHIPPDRLPGFRATWNLLCGIPLLIPDFLYAVHADHHIRQAYGTARDGEYRPWGRPGNRLAIVIFLLLSFAALPAAVLRFGFLGPVSLLDGRLRRWVVTEASSLAVGPGQRRSAPSPRQAREALIQEIAIFAYLSAGTAALATHAIEPAIVICAYLVGSGALLLNALRTLGAHRYRSGGEPMTATQQLLDTFNYSRRHWATTLWAPVGLRYHALHHLMPGIPYHNLAAAHQRLSRILPADSPYHRTTARGLIENIRTLWRSAA